MNSQVLTFADVTMLLGLVGAVLGLWWRVETRVSTGAKEAMAKALQVEKDLQDYRLEVAENYAKNGFIRDVEHRLGERFDNIVKELHGMREDFQKAMIDMASHKGRSARRT
jgi:hypothetical protein